MHRCKHTHTHTQTHITHTIPLARVHSQVQAKHRIMHILTAKHVRARHTRAHTHKQTDNHAETDKYGQGKKNRITCIHVNKHTQARTHTYRQSCGKSADFS